MKTIQISLIALACFASCAAPQSVAEPESVLERAPLEIPMPAEANVMQEGKAPTPFSADEIREGNPPGSWGEWRIEAAGATSFQRFEFAESEDPGLASISVVLSDENGDEIDTQRTRPAPWSALQGHASFDAHRTSIKSDRATTVAGEFDCWAYAVDQPNGGIAYYWFAVDRPGPPVILDMRMDGKSTMRMELVGHGQN